MTALPAAINPRPSWLIVPGALVLALAAGRVGAMGSPFLAAVAAVAFLAIGFYAFLGTRLRGLFLGFLVIVLAGYAFGGRGFAYMGAAPLYIGEVTLAIGVGAVFANGFHNRFGGLHYLLLAFIGWGLLTTVPYISPVGVDALRDAAFWGYSVFALAMWALVTRREQFVTLIRAYRFIVPVFLFLLPVIWLAHTNIQGTLPRFPNAPVPFPFFKAGDVGVHLAGVAAFILLGLYRGERGSRRVPELFLWLAWGLGLMIVVLTNRGGFLSAAVGIAALVVLRPSFKMVPIFAAGAVLVVLAAVVNPSITINGNEFSADRVTGRASSIVDREGERQGTIEWRMDWWGTIIGYTFQGEYFWTGKGFGADLAAEDGFLGQSVGLRSPHNATMTALARMGVPGLMIWLAFHVGFGLSMLKAYLSAQRRGDLFWSSIIAWLLIYWGAGIINGSFDVYWEGPQGAIWMWTVIGLGLAAMEIQRREQLAPPPSSEAAHGPPRQLAR